MQTHRGMDGDQLGALAETHLNDLQADIEAGSRLIDQVHHHAAKLRAGLPAKLRKQADGLESLMEEVARLKACVLQQRSLLRDLRHDVRALRDFVTHEGR